MSAIENKDREQPLNNISILPAKTIDVTHLTENSTDKNSDTSFNQNKNQLDNIDDTEVSNLAYSNNFSRNLCV